MDSQEVLDSIYEFDTVENTLNEELASLEKTNAPFTQISNTDQDLPDFKHEIEGNPNTDNEKNEKLFSSSKLVCSLCNKLFATKVILKQHIIFIHKKQKNFSCEICTKKFSTKYKLTLHTRDVHEKSGDFVCNFCTKRFFRKCDQILHERIHTGEKPFQCDGCEKAFHRKELLKRHSESIHSEIKFPCGLCQYESKDKSNIKRHIQRVHTDKGKEIFRASKSDECKAVEESTEDINKQIIKALKDLDCKVEPTHCCQVCGQMFCSPQDMMGHINAVHEKNRKPLL
jgi:uncharacterized Zn-finger protein